MFFEPFPRGSLPVPKPMRERVDNKQTKYDFQYGEASKQKTPRESEVRKYWTVAFILREKNSKQWGLGKHNFMK